MKPKQGFVAPIVDCLIATLFVWGSIAAASSQSESPIPQWPISAVTPWHGDLDEMIDRRVIRALVPYSRSLYFLDGATQRGIAYELMTGFQQSLNEQLGRKLLQVEIIFVPTTRGRLLPALLEGRGDVVAANLTITEQRLEQVAFTRPLGRNVRELVVGHSGSRSPAVIEDLSGKTVLLNPSSSYFERLEAVNRKLRATGRAPIEVHDAPGHFETEDILEMVNAGLADFTIADSYLARFWQQMLPELKVHEKLALSEGNVIAFATRPESVELNKALGEYLNTARKGTALGNILFNRYYSSTRFVTNAASETDRQRFLQVATFFRKYADRHDLNWLMMTAQGYQESRLDHSVKSPAGAIGIMQLLPATAADMGVEDIADLEENIRAGIKYVRYLIDNFFDEPEIDKSNQLLFALAAYNAGPGRIRSLRRMAQNRGLDANVWFNNVEHVVAERIGRETVRYVANIYKYFVAYQLMAEQGMLPRAILTPSAAAVPRKPTQSHSGQTARRE